MELTNLPDVIIRKKAHRTRKVLTLDDRMKVLNELEKGKTCRQVAYEFNVGKTQIQSINKNRNEVLEGYEKNLRGDRKRLRYSTGNEPINGLVLKWFYDTIDSNVMVNRQMIQEAALKIACELGITKFCASNGWLDCFLKRNNIVFKELGAECGGIYCDNPLSFAYPVDVAVLVKFILFFIFFFYIYFLSSEIGIFYHNFFFYLFLFG